MSERELAKYGEEYDLAEAAEEALARALQRVAVLGARLGEVREAS
jgi:methionine aminopeptidase